MCVRVRVMTAAPAPGVSPPLLGSRDAIGRTAKIVVAPTNAAGGDDAAFCAFTPLDTSIEETRCRIQAVRITQLRIEAQIRKLLRLRQAIVREPVEMRGHLTLPRAALR